MSILLEKKHSDSNRNHWNPSEKSSFCGGIAEGSADDRGELCLLGNDKADAKGLFQALKDLCHGGHGGEIACEDHVLYLEISCGKDGKHGDGLGNHIGNT